MFYARHRSVLGIEEKQQNKIVCCELFLHIKRASSCEDWVWRQTGESVRYDLEHVGIRSTGSCRTIRFFVHQRGLECRFQELHDVLTPPE